MSPKPIMWSVPRIWDGTDCYILGGGPSLKEFDVEQLRGRHVIAVNNAFKLAPWIDVMFFGDARWYHKHKIVLARFAGLKVTAAHQHEHTPGIKAVRRRNSPLGISRDPGYVTWNLSSGACAINLATHLGAGRIILLGYDMRRIDGKCNWHMDHNDATNPRKNPYERFLGPFPAIARDLNAMGIECVNATPDSDLKEFPIVTPWDAMNVKADAKEVAA